MALEENENIKDLFGSKLKDFVTDVPESVWGSINKSLSEKNLSGNRTIKLSNRKIISIAAIFVGLFLSVGLLLLKSFTDHKADGLVSSINKSLILHKQKDNYIDTINIQKYLSRSLINPDEIAYEKADQSLINPNTLIKNKITELPTLYCDAKLNNTNYTIARANGIIRRNSFNRAFTPIVLLKHTKMISKDNLLLGIHGGSGLLSANNDKMGGLMSFTTKSHPEMANEPAFKDNVIDLKHDQPISFGLMVSKQLSSNLSLETGITYTYLSSKFRTLNSDAVDEKISFHYLGIPIFLNYTFARLGKAEFYVTGGIEISKDIQGRYNSTLTNDNALSSAPINTILPKNDNKLQTTMKSIDNASYAWSHVKKNIHQDNVQFSTHFSAGASYPICHKIYLFGNIGISNYIDANNEYPTIYSDKKTQLDLNLGLKYKFK